MKYDAAEVVNRKTQAIALRASEIPQFTTYGVLCVAETPNHSWCSAKKMTRRAVPQIVFFLDWTN